MGLKEALSLAIAPRDIGPLNISII